MNRRESFQRIAMVLGGLALAPELLAKAMAGPGKLPDSFPADRLALLDEMSEMIIPTTDTPGAKAAGVSAFIVHAVNTCLPEKRQARFWEGLDQAEATCVQQTGKSFLDCNEDTRILFLKFLQSQKPESGKDDIPPFFTSLKMLVLYGYFTSEIGASQALNYDPIPGGWIADMPADDSNKAWTPVF